ncbi:LuxR C-terminal-related transcriptional regulator [Arthrobacter bambusae]|uniref:LuxR C-terminal-related transcriptional regulator n=1 Tax=Arthrobacter bambusae TaxID=1338426 RepID=UPI0027847E9E|nr:LuxR C-terminal-related transcriptional regulator [Arthrobacter bambusae]MDQ0029697.1 DNA-binding CsgD family transcriptional regulator [Arthrobacter bambusae]MDQ0097358.1 DNA-binding CsgD family transcriptional regulator [Arthrobacter bambusae]
MFDQEVRRTLDYVARGMMVRIVGAPGSGRTSVAQKAIADLEKTGATVYSISGLRSHRGIPFAGIHSLSLDIRIGQLGVLGVADTLAGRLSRPGERVLVIDDLEFVDAETVAVLDAVRLRTKRPMIFTMSESSIYSMGQAAVLSPGPEARVHLNPLRYEQVNELITDILGAPADTDTTARILTKSAGNPRLVVRIAETASLSGLIVLRHGQWHMTGETLWNEHLHGTVESLLEGLQPDELTGLQAMAIAGTAPLDVLQQVVHSDVLDRLEQRGLISVMEDRHDTVSAVITPPVLVDYFRGQRVLTARKVLKSRITRALSGLPQESHIDANSADSLMRVLAALRLERSTADAAMARHFHEQISVLERQRYEMWDADRSVANAVALLSVYWGSPVDAARIERVFAHTPTSNGQSCDLLFLAFTKALWAIHQGKGLDAAADALRSFGKERPEWSAEAEAAELFLVASYDRMPQDLDEIFARLPDPHPQAGVISSIRGILELYRFNPSGALKAIDNSAGLRGIPGIEPFIRGMALFSSGRIDESIVFALEQRTEARRKLDQFGMVSTSYAAAQGLIYRGYFDDAEYLMGNIFALGRPGFLVDSLYDAMLRLAGLRTATSAILPAATLATQARREAEDIGPLPGTARGVYELVAARPLIPAVFDAKAANLIQRQLERGYVLEAIYSALFFTCLLPGRKVLELLRQTLREYAPTSHDQLVAIAAAVVEEDHQTLDVLLEHYEPDGDFYQVRMLLRGAFKRHAFVDDTVGAAAMDRAYSMFATRFPSADEPVAFSSGSYSPLTVREIEIAALAGHRSNPEIAEHLGISIRTVESHISNALRKTGSPSRTALFDLVRDSSPFRAKRLSE